MTELNQVERLLRLGKNVVDLALTQTEGNVFENRHVRKQRVTLKHGINRALVRLRVGDILATDENLAGCRLLEPRD